MYVAQQIRQAGLKFGKKTERMRPLPFPGLKEMYGGLLHLLYPNLCVGCDADLPGGDYCFCIRCLSRLQPTDMYKHMENEFTDRLWGRLHIESGAAMYYFSRKSPIQRALHRLKYQNQPDIGVRIGRRFGHLLSQSLHFGGVQAIVPVPLHRQKERQRGYNQSAMLAQGLAESMGVPVLLNSLVRNLHTGSQTRKKRMERFENVSEVFTVKHPAKIQGKHLLLVDDVLTTGATLEACGKILLEVPGVCLSLATIAIAMK